MVFGPIFQAVLNEVKEETARKKGSPYWGVCPACGRRVVQKELIKNGCYACGWQGTEEDLEEAKTQSVNQRGQVSNLNTRVGPGLYRIHCPQCGRLVIREEMENKGCFICGYKPRLR